MEILAWVGCSQSLFVAALMFTKRDISISDKILSIWLLLLSFKFFTLGVDYKFFEHPLLSSTFLLFNPAMFFFIRSLTYSGFRLKFIHLLHLLPFLFFEIYVYIVKIPFDLDLFFRLDRHFLYRMAFGLANIASWIAYNTLSIIKLHQYRTNLQNEKSNIEPEENLTWVMAVIIFYVVYCSFAFTFAVFVYFGKYNFMILHFYNYTALLILVYLISFYGMRQPKVITLVQEKRENDSPKSYKNSTLNTENKENIKEKILEYVEGKKAYLNPNLSMDLLSESIKVPKYQITEVLNTDLGKNFFQFINHYRVEAVKEKLIQNKLQYSLEAIGYECGFSSKSSFYSVFKNITGETPINFRNDFLTSNAPKSK